MVNKRQIKNLAKLQKINKISPKSLKILKMKLMRKQLNLKLFAIHKLTDSNLQLQLKYNSQHKLKKKLIIPSQMTLNLSNNSSLL